MNGQAKNGSDGPYKTRNNDMAQKIGEMLFDSRDKTGDITFKVNGTEIKAHKCVLAALSPKYMAQLYGSFDDAKTDLLEINDISAMGFQEYLQFFYLNKVNLTHENASDVLTLTADVEEFFNECIKFLFASVTVDTVCHTYHLAVKHNKEELIERCERKISLHSSEVFLSNGFLNCTPSDLFNILQSDSLNCKETVVFESCIRWAKHNCNELDSNEVENLRKILTTGDLPGELLYQIRFGAMTIEEFMNLYGTYKELFTDEERDEIFFMIGKVINSNPKRFSDEPRNVPYQKWDESDCIVCNRIFAEIPSEKFHFGVNKTTFSVDRPMLLGGFYCGSLFEKAGNIGAIKSKCVKTNISIIRKHRLHDTDGTNLSKATEQLTFQTKQEACVKLERPIMLKPNFFYEIQLEFTEGLSLKHYEWNKVIYLGSSDGWPVQPTTGGWPVQPTTGGWLATRSAYNDLGDKKDCKINPETKTTVTFAESDGLVTCLKLNISYGTGRAVKFSQTAATR